MKSDQPRILVVDDEADICHNLADILGDLGCHVDTANEGQRALELVRQQPYDVALLDLKMPGMDGLTLYREIKKLRAGTVAIVVTAYASSATAREALAAGAWQILSKPVELPRLMGLVEQAVDQSLVMVVDDDRDLCANLWDILRERGYRVVLAHDLPDATEQLKDSAFKIVLIDMRLPRGDGGAVFRVVRKTNPGARTVLITGFPTETDRLIAQILNEGADTVCYKPFDMPKLLATLEALEAAHRRQDEPDEQVLR